jgi:Zn-dependent M28 family amino/carboxypeptidase
MASAGRVRLGVAVDREAGESRNVVGIVRGAGADAGEWVAFGAHYDHLGVVDGVIHNGADDDASGTTAILAVAEALARDRAAGAGANRSSVFVFHSAEEKGLFGSEFFTDNPDRSSVGAIERVVANINLDMVGREHPDSLYVIGHDRLSTSFGRTVEAANAALGAGGRPRFVLDRTFDAADHPENLYQRSDHYNYARFGVPIVFFTDGMGANWAKGRDRDDYHRSDDDAGLIDFGKLLDVARLAYSIGRTTADAPERPPVDRPVEPAGTD